VLGIVKHLHLGGLQSVGEIYRRLLARRSCSSAANAGSSAPPAGLLMGLHRQCPDRLSRLHPRFSTPGSGSPVGGVACLTIIPGQAEFSATCTLRAMLSFTIAHLSVIRLRIKEPDRPRRIAGPGTITRRAPLPVFALLGILGPGSRSCRHRPAPAVAAAASSARPSGCAVRDLRKHRGSPAHDAKRRVPSARRTSRSSTNRTALVPIFGKDISASVLARRQ